VPSSSLSLSNVSAIPSVLKASSLKKRVNINEIFTVGVHR
jgi:hypothetical protein